MNRQILFNIIPIKNPPFQKTTYRKKYITYIKNKKTYMKQEIQLEVIKVIETLEQQFDSKYQKRELEQLRKKYIFKDVPDSEIVRDVKYLKELSTIKIFK